MGVPDCLARRGHIVAMADTDLAGLVYFSRPYEWHESLTGEWLASLGHAFRDIFAAGYAMPIVEARSRYFRPVGLDDALLLELASARIGRSSFSLRTMISEAESGIQCIEVHVTHAWSRLSANVLGRRPQAEPAPIPEWLRRGLLPDGAELLPDFGSR